MKFSQIPSYLNTTELYMSLIENDSNQDFEINCRVEPPINPEIKNFEDFKKMFYVYDMWGHNNEKSFEYFIENNKLEVCVFLKNIENKYLSAKILLEKLSCVYIPMIIFNQGPPIVGNIFLNEKQAIEELINMLIFEDLIFSDIFEYNYRDFEHDDNDPIYGITEDEFQELISDDDFFISNFRNLVKNDYKMLIHCSNEFNYYFRFEEELFKEPNSDLWSVKIEKKLLKF